MFPSQDRIKKINQEFANQPAIPVHCQAVSLLQKTINNSVTNATHAVDVPVVVLCFSVAEGSSAGCDDPLPLSESFKCIIRYG